MEVVCCVLEAVEVMLYLLEILDGVRCVLLRMPEAVEGVRYVLEVPEVMCCMLLYTLEAVDGVRYVLELQEVMHHIAIGAGCHALCAGRSEGRAGS